MQQNGLNTATASPRSIAPLSSQASAHLNMLRGVAALVVLLGHWRNLFFLDWAEVHHKHLLLEPFYFVTKFGHEAVVVFFVLSGFLIGRTVLRPVWAGRWSAKHYAFHRIIRLELVLLPALVLCWIWDSAGIHLFSPSPTYLGTGGSSVLLYDVSHWISFRIFWGNVAFVQTLRVPPFGSDNPLWSLANEFWYYALFPCLVVLLTRSFSWIKRIIAALVMLAVAIFIGRWMLGGFLIWLFGVMLIFLPRPRGLVSLRYWLFLAGAFVLVAIQLLLTFDFRMVEGTINTDYVLGIFVTVLLYALLYYPHSVSRQYEKFAGLIAGFSYTLYLTHMPVLVFFSAWRNHRAQPTVGHFLIPIAILCLTIAYSYGIAMLFEHNTDRIRKKIETLFGV